MGNDHLSGFVAWVQRLFETNPVTLYWLAAHRVSRTNPDCFDAGQVLVPRNTAHSVCAIYSYRQRRPDSGCWAFRLPGWGQSLSSCPTVQSCARKLVPITECEYAGSSSSFSIQRDCLGTIRSAIIIDNPVLDSSGIRPWVLGQSDLGRSIRLFDDAVEGVDRKRSLRSNLVWWGSSHPWKGHVCFGSSCSEILVFDLLHQSWLHLPAYPSKGPPSRLRPDLPPLVSL